MPYDSSFDPGTPGNTWMERGRTLAGRLEGLRAELFAVPSVEPTSSVWYSGLVIDPTDFSQQLASLNTSMQQANAQARDARVPVGAER